MNVFNTFNIVKKKWKEGKNTLSENWRHFDNIQVIQQTLPLQSRWILEKNVPVIKGSYRK